ncbi:MAG: hypothetical protein ABSA41_11990 [Terriglobia bacterium]|jgi:hypothetical protein
MTVVISPEKLCIDLVNIFLFVVSNAHVLKPIASYLLQPLVGALIMILAQGIICPTEKSSDERSLRWIYLLVVCDVAVAGWLWTTPAALGLWRIALASVIAAQVRIELPPKFRKKLEEGFVIRF